jgi:tRNA (mo5U34)-methyltransferase
MNDSLDTYFQLLADRPEFRACIDRATRDLQTDPAIVAVREFLETNSNVAEAGGFSVDNDVVGIDLSPELDREEVRTALEALKPWRKGPFRFDHLKLDAEWRSDWKWQRVERVMPGLKGKRICDVGANNGYYLFRMLGHEPEFAVGVDPTGLYVAQFQLLHALAGRPPIALEPVGVEELDFMVDTFDVIFLMGILYHQSDPLNALRICSRSLRKGGRIVLETIVVPGEKPIAWFAESKYAGARGFYFLPTEPCLEQWVIRSNLKVETRTEPIPTTPEEQRRTGFRDGESLAAGLDEVDPSRTVEGYPAPQRVVWILKR